MFFSTFNSIFFVFIILFIVVTLIAIVYLSKVISFEKKWKQSIETNNKLTLKYLNTKIAVSELLFRYRQILLTDSVSIIQRQNISKDRTCWFTNNKIPYKGLYISVSYRSDDKLYYLSFSLSGFEFLLNCIKSNDIEFLENLIRSLDTGKLSRTKKDDFILNLICDIRDSKYNISHKDLVEKL